MRALIQRVRSATLSIDGKEHAGIGPGLCIFLGVTHTDGEKEALLLADKIRNLRIFEDENGKMNLSVADIGGQILSVSQFTLYADASHGRRPSFIEAARPELANPLYESFNEALRAGGSEVQTGVFGADMLVSIQNDGPVTIWLDTDIWKKA